MKREDDKLAANLAATLAANLRSAMEAKGFSTYTLPKASGVGRSTITRILACEGFPSSLALARLEVTLGARLWPQSITK